MKITPPHVGNVDPERSGASTATLAAVAAEEELTKSMLASHKDGGWSEPPDDATRDRVLHGKTERI